MTRKTTVRGKPAARATVQVRIRMYRQGLGDCFLVSFDKPGGRESTHIVIDCGVLTGSPDGPNRMRKVVEDFEAETGGVVHLLVATHEHSDHLSGFDRARDVWERITVEKTWLGWTESAPAVKALKARRERRLTASLAGMVRMSSLAAADRCLAALGQKAERIRGLLAFALDEDDDPRSLINAGLATQKPPGPARPLQ